MKKVCLIPARNSSTRLKNKNISSWGEGNLITNTINQAVVSMVFDRIILSSNDLLILDMGKKYNVETHFRDDSEDQLIGVMRQAIPDLGLDPDDILVLLLVTCPLREPWDIVEGVRLFNKFDGGHAVVSVKKNENPIQMAFKIDAGGHLEPALPADFSVSTRKQDHKDTYFFNDAFIIDTVKNWMDEYRSHLYGRMPIPYLMPWERSIAIDYEFQLKIARCLGETTYGKI